MAWAPNVAFEMTKLNGAWNSSPNNGVDFAPLDPNDYLIDAHRSLPLQQCNPRLFTVKPLADRRSPGRGPGVRCSSGFYVALVLMAFDPPVLAARAARTLCQSRC